VSEPLPRERDGNKGNAKKIGAEVLLKNLPNIK
jgi:hypothetical protein